MKQKFTVLFDLDGTLVDTAPDLMRAHNHVMKKFGYPTKSTEEIRNLVGKGAGAMIGRSIWGQAKKEFGKVQDEKIKKRMITMRSDFVSNVTHELKTPLTSINMFAESILLGRVKSEKDLKKYANVIVKESERLKRMITNILDFSRKENDKLFDRH